MSNYNLKEEDNAFFFEQLHKALATDINTTDNTTDNTCLISGMPIDKETSVNLLCGHSFNYTSLFSEVLIQKHAKNNPHKLKPHQIICPYCRTVFNHILPYDKPDDVLREYGVNQPYKWTLRPNCCSYIFKSGTRIHTPCNEPCYKNYCPKHAIVVSKQKTKSATLESTNMSELRSIAKQIGLQSYYRFRKNELIYAIRSKQSSIK